MRWAHLWHHHCQYRRPHVDWTVCHSTNLVQQAPRKIHTEIQSSYLTDSNVWADHHLAQRKKLTGLPWGGTSTRPNPESLHLWKRPMSDTWLGSPLLASELTGTSWSGHTKDTVASWLPDRYAWLVTFARHVLAALPSNCPTVNCNWPLSFRASAQLSFLFLRSCQWTMLSI